MSTSCSWLVFIYLCIPLHALQQDPITTTNASGQYFMSHNLNNVKIDCDHSIFCDLKCNDCQDLTFITNATSVSVDCTGCNYLKVYAEYSTNVTMRIGESQYGFFHLQHADNIDIIGNSIDYSTIYASHSNNFRFHPLLSHDDGGNKNNIFYLDYVTNGVFFECCSGESCKLEQSIVAASHSNYFSFRDIMASDCAIYCASHDDNICDIDHGCVPYHDIHISDTSHDAIPPLNMTRFDNPLQDNWGDIRYCKDGEECYYELHGDEQVVIYALSAGALSISCTNCTDVSILAVDTPEVTVRCVDGLCHGITLNATHVDTLDFKCDAYCSNILLSASHCRSVTIDSESIIASEINALQVIGKLTLTCNSECDLDILIPSDPSTKTSITCNHDYACNLMRIYTENGKWTDIDTVSIISCDQSVFTYIEESHNWFLFCPSSFPVWDSEYRDRCSYLTALNTPFCECDRLTNTQLIDSLNTSDQGTIMFDPFGTECYDSFNAFIYEMKALQPLFGFVMSVLAIGIFGVWTTIFIKNQIVFKFFYPETHEEVTYFEPPSLSIFAYISWSDVGIWFVQIYILVLCWGVYTHSKHDICESVPALSACDEVAICGIQGDICTLPTPSIIYSFYVLSCVSLCLAMVFVCFGSLYSSSIESDYCPRLQWEDDIRKEFFEREFWQSPKQIMMFYFVRYYCFFAAPLIFYFRYDEEEIDFNIEWFDVFPVLLVLIVNELIKKKYRMLPPYNRKEHVRYLLLNSIPIELCPERSIGLVILSFLGECHDRLEEEEESDDEEGEEDSILQAAPTQIIVMNNDSSDEDDEEDEDEERKEDEVEEEEKEDDGEMTDAYTNFEDGEITQRVPLIL